MPIHSWRDSWRTLSFAAFLTAAFVSPALADDWETCAKGAGDEAIAACTRAIKSGTYNGKTLALAYSNRGVEWRAKGDLARAIADYDEAIKADPQQPAAYNNRGIATPPLPITRRPSPTMTRRSSSIPPTPRR